MSDQNKDVVGCPDRQSVCIDIYGSEQAQEHDSKDSNSSVASCIFVVIIIVNGDLSCHRSRDCQSRSHSFSIFSLEQITCPESNDHIVWITAAR